MKNYYSTMRTNNTKVEWEQKDCLDKIRFVLFNRPSFSLSAWFKYDIIWNWYRFQTHEKYGRKHNVSIQFVLLTHIISYNSTQLIHSMVWFRFVPIFLFSSRFVNYFCCWSRQMVRFVIFFSKLQANFNSWRFSFRTNENGCVFYYWWLAHFNTNNTLTHNCIEVIMSNGIGTNEWQAWQNVCMCLAGAYQCKNVFVTFCSTYIRSLIWLRTECHAKFGQCISSIKR